MCKVYALTAACMYETKEALVCKHILLHSLLATYSMGTLSSTPCMLHVCVL